MFRRRLSILLLTALTAASWKTAGATDPRPTSATSSTIADSAGVRAEMQRHAAALLRLVQSDAARAFLGAVPALPRIEARLVYHDSARTQYWTAAEAAALAESRRVRLVSRNLDEGYYYFTRYGSPLGVYHFLSRTSLISYEASALAEQAAPIAAFGLPWAMATATSSSRSVSRASS